MPATKYTYSISQDFPGGQVNFDNLHAEVAAWAAGLSQPKVLLRVDSEEDVIDFWFSDALTPQDQLGLDGGTTNPAGGVIATHDNTITAEGESVVFDENGLVPREDLPVLAGATLSLPGDQGVVPAPQAGDHLKYLRGDGTWQDVDVSGAVQSVNGETGTVVLDSADVGADPAGTASSAVAAHEGTLDPHPQYTTAAEAAAAAPVQSVNGETGTVVLDSADVGADPAGTASSAVAAHEAAGDPHPQYTTAAEAANSAPVQSVNGEIGDVSLDAADVGADPAGTASSAVAAHEAAVDPHPQYTTAVEAAAAAPVQSVNGETGVVALNAADVGADPAGTASSAVAAHEGALDPHPQYTTASEAAAAAPVQSVNGETGAVVLDAADVGADPAGTASSAVAAHEGALDPHPQYTTVAEAAAAAPVQSVNGETGVVALDAADVGADPAGSASSAVAAHEAAGDPHPGYQRESEKDQANGYAGLTAALKVAASQIQEVIALADLTDVAAKTGTGTTVVMQGSPTLTTPTIGDFTNAPHSHTNAAGGGALDAAAIASGTLARARLPSQIAYEDEANTFSQSADFTSTVRVPRKTTPGSPVQGELYVNGADLQYRDDQGSPANQTVERQSRRAAANGYASLDAAALVPTNQLPAGPFGMHFQRQERTDFDSTTSNATFRQYLRMTTPLMPSGTYRIGWFVVWSMDTASSNFRLRVQVDDSINLINPDAADGNAGMLRIEPKDSAGTGDGGTDQRVSASGFRYVTLSPGARNIDIDFQPQSNGNQASVHHACIEIWRVG